MALEQPAIVFAPHPDDETLGCGGTILLKRKAGAKVRVAFLTDGRSSHGQFMPAGELSATRQREAVAACVQLGLSKEDLTFYPFPDGELSSALDEATACVLDLINREKPEAVFIPYSKDPQPDHQAARNIVLAALKRSRLDVTVFEYPIWFWYHWPWVRIYQGSWKITRRVLKNTLNSGMGLPALRDFRCAVNIESVMDEKKAALDQHQTQMVRPPSIPLWPVLADVSGGDFLACFFQKKEVFYRYSVNREG